MIDNIFELPFCKCGCGEKVSKMKNSYIWGHYSRGKEKSEDHKKKLSESIKRLQQDPNSVYNTEEYREKHRVITKNRWKDSNSVYHTRDYRDKLIKGVTGENNGMYGKTMSLESKKQMSRSHRPTLEIFKERYPFFCKVEELRKNLNEDDYIRVEVRCKWCSKWFVPLRDALYSRIYALERSDGNDGLYFYCSKKCKKECPVYRLQPSRFKMSKENEIEYPYTSDEYEIFRQEVLKRDNYQCLYCSEPATNVHHTRPVKLEPFFVLDPDLAISCCRECHYKYGHKIETECSTGSLSHKVCIK